MTNPMDDAEQDAWQGRLSVATSDYAQILSDLHETNLWPVTGEVLPWALGDLVTSLWDRCFSQTEIRAAIDDAVAALTSYAAGEDVRP